MYQYKFSQSQSNQIKDAISSKSSLIDELDEISKKYSFNANPNFAGNDPTLKLEKATYVPKTSQELASISQTSLSPFKDQSLKEIKKENQSQLSRLAEQEAEAKSEFQTKKSDISNNLSSALEGAKQKVLSQGIARSSIAQNIEGELRQNAKNQVDLLQNQVDQSLAHISAKKLEAETEMASALESFDIEYAAKLSEKIAKLQEDEAKMQLKIIEQNNSVDKKLADFEKSLVDQNMKEQKLYNDMRAQYLEILDKYGQAGVDQIAQQDKLNAAKTFYSNMQKQDAINHLANNSHALKDHLGKRYDELVQFIVTK